MLEKVILNWTAMLWRLTEPDEKQTVGHRKLRLGRQASTQDVQLMPQQYDLGFQPRSRLERRDHDVGDQAQQLDHPH
jgi:hypothetical protein